MDFVRSCTYLKAQYLYVTNPVWSHAPRTRYSPHNLIFVTEGILYIEQDGNRYEVREGQCIFLKKGSPARAIARRVSKPVFIT